MWSQEIPVPATAWITRLDSQSSAEASISFFKQLMSKAVQSCNPSSRRNWNFLTPHVVQVFNSSRLLASQYCRVSLRYSPLSRINAGLGTAILQNDEDLASIHRAQLTHIRDQRRHAMFKHYSFMKSNPINPGAVCFRILLRHQHKTVDGSKQLLENIKDIVVVLKGPEGLMYKVKSLIDQDETWVHRNSLERVSLEDFYGFKLSEDQLFKNISTARVNRSYKRLSKGLYLSARPVSHRDRELEYSFRPDSEETEFEYDTVEPEPRDMDPQDVSLQSSSLVSVQSVHFNDNPDQSSETMCQSVSDHTNQTVIKSILKVKQAPPPAPYAMSKQELKALINGIKLSKNLNIFYKIFSNHFRNFNTIINTCQTLLSESVSRSAKIVRANISLHNNNSANPHPKKISFTSDTFFPTITRKDVTVINANAVKLCLQHCASLREIMLNTNLFH